LQNLQLVNVQRCHLLGRTPSSRGARSNLFIHWIHAYIWQLLWRDYFMCWRLYKFIPPTTWQIPGCNPATTNAKLQRRAHHHGTHAEESNITQHL